MDDEPLAVGSTVSAAWIRQFGSSGIDTPAGTAVDLAGSVYVTGTVKGPLDGNSFAGSLDVVLVKYDTNGARQWTREFGGPLADYAGALAVDAAGNVLLASTMATGSIELLAKRDALIVKYDTNGTQLWSRQLGTDQDDWAQGVATDPAGNTYVVGTTEGSLDGNGSAGMRDIFVTKLDETGATLWTRQLGSSAIDRAFAAASDRDGSIHLLGYAERALVGNGMPGLAGMLVAKYAPNGDLLWVQQPGAGYEQPAAIATDAVGNLYVVGATEGGIDGKPAVGLRDHFVAKYASNGAQQWTRSMGGPGDDLARGVATDTNGSLYVVGQTECDSQGRYIPGGPDILVVKHDPNGEEQWSWRQGTRAFDAAEGVAVDHAANLYVVGATDGALGNNVGAGEFDIVVEKLVVR